MRCDVSDSLIYLYHIQMCRSHYTTPIRLITLVRITSTCAEAIRLYTVHFIKSREGHTYEYRTAIGIHIVYYCCIYLCTFQGELEERRRFPLL